LKKKASEPGFEGT